LKQDNTSNYTTPNTVLQTVNSDGLLKHNYQSIQHPLSTMLRSLEADDWNRMTRLTINCKT